MKEHIEYILLGCAIGLTLPLLVGQGGVVAIGLLAAFVVAWTAQELLANHLGLYLDSSPIADPHHTRRT